MELDVGVAVIPMLTTGDGVDIWSVTVDIGIVVSVSAAGDCSVLPV